MSDQLIVDAHRRAARLMFGSDRPVCLLAGSYGEVYAATVAALPQLSRPQMSDIVAGTAIRTYGLAGRIAELAAATM